MNNSELFRQQVQSNIDALANNAELPAKSLQWMLDVSLPGNYSYNFAWMGRPIIQYPQDMVIMQELIWAIKPDLIIETGIAHGGSLILNASLLAMLDYTEAVTGGEVLDPLKSKRKVIGIDIDIRQHNREAIESHPLAHKIQMFQGSSIDENVIATVKQAAQGYERILVCLDSNHTHQHVLEELNAYAPLVSSGSYCVVFDTLIEDMPDSLFSNREWRPGNSPKTAVREFLKHNSDFIVDTKIDAKLQITVAREGFLKRL
ncbi:cephalosporin hydroxylase family protein [Cellvibrio sp. pealriver]|uniref:cephalosporin hydroxylase family protein n=1 Tax=Cellvibrio sp. pealriver TaxID=1622269 RepID=UPI00066FBF1A|nr:cephalosporin hydroxylase family protein [Cellvibrio sp. pealriver]